MKTILPKIFRLARFLVVYIAFRNSQGEWRAVAPQ